ncbi:MAG TPA: hypothetical protein VFP31_03635 [Gaiellaceae bacterium]|nr:hypothetical protein [Gaiellaceae bacterium]
MVCGRAIAPVLTTLAVALGLAPTASAAHGLLVGVTDDTVKWRGDTPGIVRIQREAGFGTVKVTFPWRPGMWHAGSVERFYVERVARMTSLDQHVVLAFGGSADDAPRRRATRQQFCSYVRDVVAQLPNVSEVVIWNEVNSPAFWRPQRDAPAKYTALLARCWDLLHGMRPDVKVISSTAPSHRPLDFLTGMGAAYVASGRTRPIVDAFGHNPYPRDSSESPVATHDDGYVGQGDYGQLVDTIRASFAGTAQPAPGVQGVSIWYLENGFQTAAPRRSRLYHGRENESRPLGADDQARQLIDALKLAYCSQPFVDAFFNFQLADERRLAGWQSGVLWANWRPKPSSGPVRDVITAIRTNELACV